MASVRDSQKDLISVTVSDAPAGAATGWTRPLAGQRRVVGGLAVTVLVCMGLLVALVVVTTTNNKTEVVSSKQEVVSSRQGGHDVCMTEGCIGRII